MPKKSLGCIGYLIEAIQWFPVVISSTVFAWGYYAYVFHICLYSMQSLVQQILCLVVFHILFIFATWSYLQTIFTPYNKIPAKFYLSPEISEDLAKAQNEQQRDEILAYVVKRNDLPVYCRTYNGGIRYCEKCNLIKPDRSHHCSICGICILKMDHHCPWINNCVSFTNYKFFVLFLGYTFALSLFAAATTFPYFFKLWVPPEVQYNNITTNNNVTLSNNINSGLPANSVPFSVRFHILFLFFVTSMLSLGLMFLYCYHVYLLLNNRSTLESFRPPLLTYGPDRNAFNLGRKENVHQLFGKSKLLWFVPIFTTQGSGLAYDLRPQMGHADEEVRQELLNHHAIHNGGGNNNNSGSSNNNSRPDLVNTDTIV